uniref:Uncharacterized protein n=1 Tax=Octopus bimaculoides TaxID=37653 RepID=A0A0L8HCQ1_OCTBM
MVEFKKYFSYIQIIIEFLVFSYCKFYFCLSISYLKKKICSPPSHTKNINYLFSL